MNSSYFCFDSIDIARRRNRTLSLRHRKETHADKETMDLLRSLLTGADVFLAVLLFFFHPLRISWGRFRENEWTLYPGLNLKHSRNDVRKAWLTWRPGIISPVIAMLRQSVYKNGYSPMEINVVCIKTGISA